MAINPNTHPAQTVRSDGVATTVHRRNEGAAKTPSKARVLPPLKKKKDDLGLLQQLAEGSSGVVVFQDDSTPDGYEMAYVKVLGIYTNYLLKDDGTGNMAIVGRVEEHNGSYAAYAGNNIKGGHYITDGKNQTHAEMFHSIVAHVSGHGSAREETHNEWRTRVAAQELGGYHAPKGRMPAKTKNRPSPRDINNWSVEYDMSDKNVTTEQGSTDYAGVRNFTVYSVTPKDADTKYFFGEMAYYEAKNFADGERRRIAFDELRDA
jgi:hypothetical protein